MKRFFTLSFLLTSFVLFGQNLIPDGSAENVAECPFSFGNIDAYTSSWQSFRGSPDYWHNCSTNEGLGWDNSLGFQEPRSGNGFLGLLTFSKSTPNVREYLGVELTTPLTIGQEYFLTFYVSRAHQANTLNAATNNIGALLLIENNLNPEEQGPTPNFANFNEIEVVEDTVNWVEMSYQFIADEAYQFVAFGNFYDDSLTDTLRIGGEPTGEITPYYFFDDFCLTTSPDGCDFTNSTDNSIQIDAKLYPNPCRSRIRIENTAPLDKILFYSLQGELLRSYQGFGKQTLQIDFSLNPGMYLAVIESEGKRAIKRFVVEN